MVLMPKADLEPIFLLGMIANILRIQAMKRNPNHDKFFMGFNCMLSNIAVWGYSGPDSSFWLFTPPKPELGLIFLFGRIINIPRIQIMH